MPWTYTGKVIREGRSWTDNNGVTHPTNWAVWSDAEKAAKGLTWLAPAAPFDNRFYWGRDADGNLIEKAIDDVNATDENGDPVLDEDGVQVITRGLKYNAIQTAKAQAAGQLASTDWYITRNAETGDAIPSDVTTYRAAVRTASNTIEAAITACTTHADFMALYVTPVDGNGDPTGNAPINDWPEAI